VVFSCEAQIIAALLRQSQWFKRKNEDRISDQ
jgi:hypothetical protein